MSRNPAFQPNDMRAAAAVAAEGSARAHSESMPWPEPFGGLREKEPGLEPIRHIGDEQFGHLLLAREASPPRLVVVKVLRREFRDNVQSRLRFERAVRSNARITHANVITVLRVGTLDNGMPYAVEQYVGDCTLHDRRKAVGRFTAPMVRHVLRQLASALAAAHRRGIVHRNVCPHAVRCESESDRVFLTDFGMSGILETATLDEIAITNTNQLMGSPEYVSPEQTLQLRVTDRADVYSLGVLGWKLLTDNAPVPGNERDAGQSRDIANEDPDLKSLIFRCLRKAPNERPSASDVVEAIDHGRFEPPRLVRWWPRWPQAFLQRRIPHFVVPYLVTALGALAVVAMFVEMTVLPRWAFFESLTLAIAGLLVVFVIAWNHGETGRQETTWPERLLLGAIVTAWASASIIVWFRWRA